MEKEIKTELEISNQLEITPDNRDKEIKSEDLNMLINAASNMYTGLAISIVDSLERLEIISPVVNKETLMSLEKKANGLSVNLLRCSLKNLWLWDVSNKVLANEFGNS